MCAWNGPYIHIEGGGGRRECINGIPVLTICNGIVVYDLEKERECVFKDETPT